MSKQTEIMKALDAKRRKLTVTREQAETLQTEATKIEREIGVASANDDEAATENLDRELKAMMHKQGRHLLTIDALEDQVKALEAQLAAAEAHDRARETAKVARLEQQQRAKLKATIETLIADATALEATWSELGLISGTQRRASDSLTVALACALKGVCPKFRDLIVMHPQRNAGLAALDQHAGMFAQRAERATAPGGRTGEEVEAARAAVEGAK